MTRKIAPGFWPENITIKMPHELRNKWLKALRSGEYRQTRKGGLKIGKGYCCLGVLCSVAGVEDDAMKHLGVPTIEMMDSMGAYFRMGYESSVYKTLDKLDPIICVEDGIPKSASEINDQSKARFGDPRQYNFKQIADMIEACSEGF